MKCLLVHHSVRVYTFKPEFDVCVIENEETKFSIYRFIYKFPLD